VSRLRGVCEDLVVVTDNATYTTKAPTNTKHDRKVLSTAKCNSNQTTGYLWAGIAQSVQRLAKGWTVRGLKPGGSEIFRTRPDRP
jgi:hypothetical protein